MNIKRLTARVLPAFLLAASLGAVGTTSVNTASAAGPRIVPGEQAHEQTHKLTSEIHWYTNVNSAEAEARRENKLVFWMHMLGTLDGTT